MSGHRLTGLLNFYGATKFCVTALTEGFRRELVEDSKIRITVGSKIVTPFMLGNDI